MGLILINNVYYDQGMCRICVYTCVRSCVCERLCVCVCVFHCVCACACGYMCACVYVCGRCMYAWAYIHVDVHALNYKIISFQTAKFDQLTIC